MSEGHTYAFLRACEHQKASKSGGLFTVTPERDMLFTGLVPEEPPPAGRLSYKGTYRRGSRVQHIHGEALFWGGKEPGTRGEFEGGGMSVYLWFEGYVMHMVWSSSELSLSIPWDDTFTIPAAKFMLEVEVSD